MFRLTSAHRTGSKAQSVKSIVGKCETVVRPLVFESSRSTCVYFYDTSDHGTDRSAYSNLIWSRTPKALGSSGEVGRSIVRMWFVWLADIGHDFRVAACLCRDVYHVVIQVFGITAVNDLGHQPPIYIHNEVQ